MKLIIDIPDWHYRDVHEFKYPTLIDKAIRDGVPLNDVKAEFVNSYPKNYMGEPELNGAACHFSLNKVLEILESIGKVESEGT